MARTIHEAPGEEVVLSARGVRKKIGRKWIIDDVTFDVKKARFSAFSVRMEPAKPQPSACWWI